MKNYPEAWITGSENQQSSNVTDHANTEQHKSAMSRHSTEQARANNQPITVIAPIARRILNLGESEKDRLQNKFDICYMMARKD